MIVAALYFNMWHRAVIKEYFPDDNKLAINYIDYGTPAVVPRSHIRILDRQFAQMPAQAIRAKLAHIRPLYGGTEWCVESAQLFLEMIKRTHDLGVVAEVRGVARSITAISVWLYDTMTNDLPKGIEINMKLIENRYAELCSDVEDDSDELERSIARSNTRQIQLGAPQHPLRTPMDCEDTKAVLETFIPDSESKSAFSPIRKPAPGIGTVALSQALRPIAVKTTLPEQRTPVVVETVRFIEGRESHVIFMNGRLFMTSAEISALIPKFKSKDVLVKMLRLKKAKIDCVTASSQAYEDLFEKCIL